jgi:hypothetical protein
LIAGITGSYSVESMAVRVLYLLCVVQPATSATGWDRESYRLCVWVCVCVLLCVI